MPIVGIEIACGAIAVGGILMIIFARRVTIFLDVWWKLRWGQSAPTIHRIWNTVTIGTLVTLFGIFMVVLLASGALTR